MDSLHFRIQHHSTGMWYLVVFAIAFQDFRLFKIWTDAAFPNQLKIVRPPKDYFPKSGNLQLMCDAEGDPVPIITWYYQKTKIPVEKDKSIDLKLYPDQGLLIINNPREKETYEFYCNASNDRKWVISNPVKTGLSYLLTDFIIQPPKIIIMKESETVTLPCQLPLGNPVPKGTWFKNKKPLLSGEYFMNDDNQIISLDDGRIQAHKNNNCSLQISNLKVSDSGRYHCVATNDYQRLESHVSWLLVMNSFQDKIFDVIIKQIRHKAGDDLELLCHSSYKENVRWISSKELIANDQMHIYENKILKRNLKLDDRGVYACETNESSPTLLQVFNLSVISFEPVDEKLKIQKKVVIEGVNVMLECDLENTKAEVSSYDNVLFNQIMHLKNTAHS